jgi:competence protein ComEC
MVCALGAGVLCRRPVVPANALALAWLVVAAVNPADVVTLGCQLSFLCVVVLYWGMGRVWTRETDPLQQLLEESRPLWQQFLRGLGRLVVASYAVNFAIWLAIAPLIAVRGNLVSPIGLLIGPPCVLLTSVALLAGFALLLLALLGGPLCQPAAALTSWGLAGCQWLVDTTLDWPGASWYVGGMQVGWLWLFYPLLLGLLAHDHWRAYWRWLGLAGLGLTLLATLTAAGRPASQELRCTFLAVGHGSCTVIETPDGRTLVYDAGSMQGPEVTRRHLAPFLWHRGIRCIDELFVSHADLDHYNGIPALLERFTVRQVTLTPSFSERDSPGAALTLKAIRDRRIPVRVVKAGDRLSAGAAEIEVLHPPAVGPEGKENVRSLVLLVRHEAHALLLTGDLEEKGLRRVLDLAPMQVDVLMAPHHGARDANPHELAQWALPQVAVSSQGSFYETKEAEKAYTKVGARFLRTAQHGAVTVRSGPDGLVVETFTTGKRFDLAPRAR